MGRGRTPKNASPTRRLILVVEDNPGERMTLRALLEDEGYAVAEAATGQAALHYVVSSAEEPWLILLDLEVAAMSGWELVAILKSYTRLARIPIVAMSEEEPHPETVARGTIARFLKKPVGRDALLELLRALAGPSELDVRD